MNRKVCVVTGSRAEYGIMKFLIRKIAESPSLDLHIIVTGTHLIPEYGLTIRDIISDGFPVDSTVPMIVAGNSKISMATSIGVGVVAFTQAFSDLKPDIVIVLGDRFEILAASIAASYSGLVLAHLAGGDKLSAGYDEYTRHAITKIAHIHFPFTEKCAERLRKMGEEHWRVIISGSPSVDTIFHSPLQSPELIRKKYNIPEKKEFCIVIQHPISTNPDNAEKEMNETLSALKKYGIFSVIIAPNVDPGSYIISQLIDRFTESEKNSVKLISIPYEDYLSLMSCASVLVGNSSSAILEAPSFHVPSINIGTRQKGREQGGNVINVDPCVDQIYKGLVKALEDDYFRNYVISSNNPYGDGNASNCIIRVINELIIDDHLFQKKITY